ncbi:TIM barrel protein [Alicyclobacillus fastidiosus]|uniref:TIM barrel protein n=1 Tax=Alicyclobacillus fastidiosus TaxID=392011 RepID=A0ABY6ZNL3_9BACL|nr:TIM barrel protein [Alicyclobacillus fastidiosus]WAH44425.1 TIM barrel protein [Alicyclobacillus fastidiosus]GMA60766.1 sugar phosphate isomerase [Alicyclobacillus fastidiosus]
MQHVNLKCSLSQLQIEDRLKYSPNIVELQLFENDISSPNSIVEAIQQLKENSVKVFLHHPMKVNGKFLDVLSKDPEVYEFYRLSCSVLNEICNSEDVFCVVHPHYEKCESGMVDISDAVKIIECSNALKEAIQDVRTSTYDRFLWENAPRGIFSSANRNWLTHVVEPIQLPICYDISHSFMSFRGNNLDLERDLRNAFPFTRHYHVVDSAGTEVHDAMSLGLGGINWSRLKPYILQRDFIFEIDLPNYNDCTPMIQSAVYFDSI